MRRFGLPFRLWSTEALVIVLVVTAAAGIVLYVRDATRQIRQALPAEVLEQQRDIAVILQDLTELRRVVEVGRLDSSTQAMARIHAQLAISISKLQAVRRNYNFDDLTAATRLHAIVEPALTDIERWLGGRLRGYAGDSPVVLELAFLRIHDTHQQVQALFAESNRTASNLVRSEAENLEHLRDSLQSYLLIFALFAVGVLVLFVRQLNAEARLSLTRKRLGDAIESINEGFTLLDEKDRLVECNRRFNELYPQVAAATYPGMPFREICQLGFVDGPAVAIDGATDNLVEDRMHRHLKLGEPFEVKLRDGRWVLVSERRTREGGSVQLHTEITELKKAQQRLEELATHDRLTGLPNRAHFEERFNHAIAHSRRHGTETALLFIDLDRFKQINDSHGHAGGDALLHVVAARILACLRGGDTVSRLGGDEFTVVIENVCSWSEVSATARRILTALAQPCHLDEHEVVATASVGVALYPRDGTNIAALLKAADTACYHAKAQGRNNFQFYTEDMNRKARQHLQLEQHLRLAVERGEFAVHYQPIIDLQSRNVVGMEALLRWHNDILGEVPPEIFIPLAEESGLIDAITRWVLRRACRQNAAWREQGIDDLRVCVNVAGAQLRLGDLSETVAEALQDANLLANGLALEIAEATIGAGLHRAEEILQRIGAMGVEILVDDFGAGMSSLATLKRLPLSHLKIDLSLVQDITHDEDDRMVVTAIIAMAAQLRVQAVAEGVDTSAQLDLLRANGLRLAQGNILGHPMPAGQATAFLNRSRADTHSTARRLDGSNIVPLN